MARALWVLLIGIAAFAVVRMTARAPDAPDASAAEPSAAAPTGAAADAIDEELRAIRALLSEQQPERISRLERLLVQLEKSGDARRDAIACELAVLLNNRATIAANEKRTKSADVDSARAVLLCPNEPKIKKNRATMLLALALDEDRKTADGRKRARELLEKGLALEEQPAALASLGEIMYADDDVAGAVAKYERALEIGNSDQWQQRLDELKKKAAVEATFSDRKHEHFVARFEGYAQEQLAWTALDELEEAYFSVGRALDVFPREPITVIIYTGDQYKRAVNVPDWSSGVFDGKIRIAEGQLAAERGQLRAILRHEYTHAVLATLNVPLPTWMNEGLAEHFEGSDVEQSTQLCARAKEQGVVLTYADVAGPFITIQDRTRAQLAYAAATSMVGGLVASRGAYSLVTFASHLKRGEAFDSSFKDTFSLTPEQVFARWWSGL